MHLHSSGGSSVVNPSLETGVSICTADECPPYVALGSPGMACSVGHEVMTARGLSLGLEQCQARMETSLQGVIFHFFPCVLPQPVLQSHTWVTVQGVRVVIEVSGPDAVSASLLYSVGVCSCVLGPSGLTVCKICCNHGVGSHSISAMSRYHTPG